MTKNENTADSPKIFHPRDFGSQDTFYIPSEDRGATKDDIQTYSLPFKTLIPVVNGYYLEIPAHTVFERFKELKNTGA